MFWLKEKYCSSNHTNKKIDWMRIRREWRREDSLVYPLTTHNCISKSSAAVLLCCLRWMAEEDAVLGCWVLCTWSCVQLLGAGLTHRLLCRQRSTLLLLCTLSCVHMLLYNYVTCFTISRCFNTNYVMLRNSIIASVNCELCYYELLNLGATAWYVAHALYVVVGTW